MAKRKWTRYSPEKIAEVLAVAEAHDNNQSLTAAITGIPRTTVAQWTYSPPVSSELRQAKQEEFATTLEAQAREYFDNAFAQRHTAAFQDLVRAGAILTDKALLLRGQATSITRRITDDPEEMRRRILDALGPCIDAEPLPEPDTDTVDNSVSRGTSVYQVDGDTQADAPAPGADCLNGDGG